MQTINLRKARAFDEVLRDTFVFIRVMLKPFLRGVLPIAGPFFLITAILTVATTFSAQDANNIVIGEHPTSFSPSLLSILGTMAGTTLALTLSYFMLFVSGSVFMVLYVRHGKPPIPAEVWVHTKDNILNLLGTGIIAGFITGISFVFFIIPGIYVSVALWIVFIVRLQERISASGAVSRCFDLVQGYWWQTAGIFFVFQLLSAAADYVLELPVELLDMIAPATVIGDTSYTIGVALLTAMSLVLSMFTYIPLIVAPAFQYYNLVECKEAVGLQEKIQGMVSEEEGWEHGEV